MWALEFRSLGVLLIITTQLPETAVSQIVDPSCGIPSIGSPSGVLEKNGFVFLSHTDIRESSGKTLAISSGFYVLLASVVSEAPISPDAKGFVRSFTI